MEEEEGFPNELSPNFGGDEDEAMESAEEGEPEGEEGLEVDTPTEEHDNPPPGHRMEAPAAMVTALEQQPELNDRVTMKEEPSPERGTPGPKREAPRREPIGPKRMAPPRDPDDNQPKRPAHAPAHRPEPDAEPADRGNRRPVPPPGHLVVTQGDLPCQS
eukprot:743499-Amphidinium_carterae.1